MGNGTHDTGKQSQSIWTILLEFIKVGIPIGTLVFGYFIYGAQAELQSKVDANGKVLSNQLAFQSALREEFYKRRLTVYENACKELADASAALSDAGTSTEDVTHAYDAIRKFNALTRGNTLYWSTGVQDGLNDFWELGIEKLQRGDSDSLDVNQRIKNRIAALNEQMKTDLNVADLSILKQGK
ncbi:MAG: hypothetical protein QOH70_3132 [Blastocatellia bacterium]|jgi:uncharacterized membrane protein|nr:hypothetical protein [Blastocatellia bacterium]